VLGVTHWSSRLLGAALGISHSTVARVWAEHDVNEPLEAARVLPSEPNTFGPTRHDEIQKGSVAAVSEERRPDTQAELANERTYLAWLRMGLALVAVGVAAEQVLPAEGIIWARQLVGVSLILTGILTAGLARWRWQTVDRAMRAGRPIPPPTLGYVVAAAIVLGGLATIVLLLRADAG
jgi:putative membrane protein